MILDKRIEKDLKELYDTGEISGAKELDDLIKTDRRRTTLKGQNCRSLVV